MREIKTVIVLNKKQTKEFIHSLEHPKNKTARERIIRRARETKFEVKS